jgi:hypothetical protein
VNESFEYSVVIWMPDVPEKKPRKAHGFELEQKDVVGQRCGRGRCWLMLGA